MKGRSLTLLWLLPAGAAAMLAGANFMVPLGAWLAPIFMLRFVRFHSPWVGLGLGALVQVVAWQVGWKGVLPFGNTIAYGVIAGVALLMWLPYVADRLLRARVPGFASTLIFPLAWVTVEFHFSMAGFGTWGAVAYTQWGHLPLLQLVGITGLWGVTFLIGWTAAVVNWVWERRFQLDFVALTSAGVMVTILLAGSLRLALLPPSAPTVQLASITVDNMDAFVQTWAPLQRGRALTGQQAEEVRGLTHSLHETLLDATRREAAYGANIILWSEGNALVLKQDEAGLIERGSQLAVQERIYLFMSIATFAPGEPLVQNKTVGIGPDGTVLGEYLKSHPTPVEQSVPGDDVIPVVTTPYGRIGWAICYDYDFPGFMRQAGQAGVDILLNPSWDSPQMSPLHTHMAMVRAIETGAALVRQTNDGLSMAVDHQGRVLAQMDHHAASGPVRVMVSHVPTRGSGPTVYSQVGDLFAWLASGALVALGLLSLRSGFRRPASPASSAP